jgi:hypothetical protein
VPSSPSGQSGDRVAARPCGKHVGEVGVERAAFQSAGLVDGEQALDRAFAALGADTEGELAVDDGGAKAALGALLVGSTSGTSAKVHSAGHSFRRFVRHMRPCVAIGVRRP